MNLVSWQLKSANVKAERSVILIWGSYIIFQSMLIKILWPRSMRTLHVMTNEMETKKSQNSKFMNTVKVSALAFVQDHRS